MASSNHPNNYPKLHNAAWPGVVGKGRDSEPPIDLDTMLDLTAAAEVDGQKFDGFDLFLFAPHVDIDASDDELKTLADKASSRGAGDRLGRRAGLAADRRRLGDGERRRSAKVSRSGAQGLPHRQQAARAGHSPRRRGADRLGQRRQPNGAKAIRKRIAGGSPTRFARPARSPRNSASGFRPRAKSAGAACTVGGGWCSFWKWSIARKRSAFRPTWPTRCCTCWAYNAPEDAILPADFDWNDTAKLDAALKQVTAALRPWTNDFHVAQNDATVHGTGSHDKTGRHCLPNDPNGKLEHRQSRRLLAPRRRAATSPRSCRHICWDGCMFPNAR